MVKCAEYPETSLQSPGDLVMSSSGGIIRFLLFIAVIALGATAYYAHGQNTKLEAYRRANAALTEERDSLSVKNSELTTAAKSIEVKLQESEAKLAQLQEQIDAAKKPRARR
jgi:uncharacterized protein HemX